jgi:RimJ/RimL family protein N-acetyltransferase
MVQLMAMTESEYQQWLEIIVLNYAQEHVEAGSWTAEVALQKSREEMTQLLPEGIQTKDQYLYKIVTADERQKVGVLWFAKVQRPGGKPQAFVYDIEIDEPFRRHGYASQAFAELEKEARALGLVKIGLHVFGHNQAARTMYEKLGYQTTNIQMAKLL